AAGGAKRGWAFLEDILLFSEVIEFVWVRIGFEPVNAFCNKAFCGKVLGGVAPVCHVLPQSIGHNPDCPILEMLWAGPTRSSDLPSHEGSLLISGIPSSEMVVPDWTETLADDQVENVIDPRMRCFLLKLERMVELTEHYPAPG
ncbi:hypothetical protein L195_g039718, partial [Trifolium pratense]